jgi:hypothetical protein
MGIGDYFLDSDDVRNEDEYRGREWQTQDAMRRLGESAPTVDDLVADYSMENAYGADVRGPDRSELGTAHGEDNYINAALRMLQEQAGTQGFTPAERAMMQASERNQAQMARSQRDAIAQQAEARGMGGSGMALVQSQLAGEQATQRQADYQAQMQMAAQQRALQSMQALGGLGGAYYGQTFDQEATRRGAIDDFNRWQTEYRRDVSGRNAQRRDAQAEQRAGGSQQVYENSYQRTRDEAGDRGEYGNAIVGERRFQQQRDDARAAQMIDTVSSTVGGAAGGGGG